MPQALSKEEQEKRRKILEGGQYKAPAEERQRSETDVAEEAGGYARPTAGGAQKQGESLRTAAAPPSPAPSPSPSPSPEPKRSDFPPGVMGDLAYNKAMKAHKAKK